MVMRRISLVSLLLGIVASASAQGPPELDSPFGVNQPPWASPPSNGIAMAYEAGFRWMRLFLDWDQIEQTQGSYQWGEYGQRIRDAHAQGFAVIAVLHNTPDWAHGQSCGDCVSCSENNSIAWPPTDASYFYNFAREAALTFSSEVHAWELWQEVNHCAQWKGKPKDYRQMILKPGYDAVKSADPTDVVVAPGISQQPSAANLDPWLTYYSDAQQKRFLTRPIDIYSFHRYGAVATVKNAIDVAQAYFRCTVDGECLDDFWLTEFGYSSAQGCGSCGWGEPADPGVAATQVLDHCTGYCKKAFYWDLAGDDLPCTNGNPTCDYALVAPDGSLRPKFCTLQEHITGRSWWRCSSGCSGGSCK